MFFAVLYFISPLNRPANNNRKRPNNNDRNATKHGRGGRTAPRDGKRAYDRRSGTGRGRDTKKGGGGARNWGSDKNEARQNEGHVEETALDEPKEEGTENNEAVEEAEAEPEPEPVVDNTVSYEDYLASKQNPDNEAFAPVKEREVANEFAGLKVKEKEVEDTFMMTGGKQKKKKEKKNNEKQTLALDFRVASSSGGDDRGDRGGRGGGRGRGGRGRGGRDGGGRGRGDRGGGRGGRGGGRGGRGRGGGRGGGINLDSSAFPSL